MCPWKCYNSLYTSDCEYKHFVDILETFDFGQHIDLSTHTSGYLFDYLITRKLNPAASN